MRYLCLILLCLLEVGCEQQTAVVSDANVVGKQVSSPVAEVQQQDDPDDKPSTAKRFLELATKVIDEKAKSGSQEARKLQEMMADKLGDVTESGSQITEDATKWANDAFNSLKDKGLTSADSAKDWVTQDIRNMNALKYKVIEVSLDDLSAVEDQLNELGELRWDCFHAVEQGSKTVLFFKKERRSILKNIPVKDMLRLVPLMNDGSTE